jgi:glutathione S-transferase
MFDSVQSCCLTLLSNHFNVDLSHIQCKFASTNTSKTIQFLVQRFTLQSAFQKMVLTVHHLENSQSLRIVWLLEELGLPYELKLYKRNPHDMLAPPELKAISPLGTSPVITEEPKLVLCETNAIIDFILDKETENASPTPFRPPIGSQERLDYLFFFHGGPASLGTNVSGDYVWSVLIEKVPYILRGILRVIRGKVQETVYGPRISIYLDVLEAKLSSGDFVAGPYITAADITLIYPVEMAFKLDPAREVRYPYCKGWLQRMYGRDAYKRALAKVGESIQSHHMQSM